MSPLNPLTPVLLVFAYLLGSMPFAVFIAKVFKGPDPRSAGSGNVGATNVARTTGKAAGALTLLADIAKGALPVLLAAHLAAGPLVISLAGLSVFLGHLYPVFLKKFRGGKGVATACGVFLVIAPLALGAAVVIFIAAVLATRYVSVGSVAATLSIPVFFALFPAYREFIPLGLVVAVLITLKHRENFKRIRQGSESRFR